MAWRKTWTDPDTGVTGDFNEFIDIFYSQRSGQSEIRSGVWVSQAAYDAGKQPIHVVVKTVPGGTNPQLASGALQFATAYMLAQPEFEGAEVIT